LNPRPACNQWRIIVIIGLIISVSSPSHALLLRYSGVYKKTPINVVYVFDTTHTDHKITATITGAGLVETNESIMRNNTLIQMTQSTKNDIDQKYFEWSISRSDDTTHIEFYRQRFQDSLTATFSSKVPMVSLQGLIYLLQNEPLEQKKTIRKQLLVPWKSVIPLSFSIIKETVLFIDGHAIPSYVVRIQLNGFFGTILPKATLWVSQKKPHIMLKQTGLNGTYQITNMDSIVTQWHDAPK
jgi:hypothetical protein